MILTVAVNGQDYSEEVEPRLLLVDFLRDSLGLVGANKGCDTSVCGACTVIIDGRTAKACSMLAVQAEGSRITTIEGLAGNGKLHPLQQAFWDNHGLQCGFCTPGMILTAMAMLEENPRPTVEEIRDGLKGNICRCTGYEGIIKSIQAATNEAAGP